MSNKEKYGKAFVNALGITEDLLKDDLEYNKINEWDSIAHMTLVSELEDTFEVSLDADEIVDLSTYKKGKEILEKHGVKF